MKTIIITLCILLSCATTLEQWCEGSLEKSFYINKLEQAGCRIISVDSSFNSETKIYRIKYQER